MYMKVKSLVLSILALACFTGCDDKVKYVDVHGECKYIEVRGELFMCSEMVDPNEFELVYVAPCMEKTTKNGVKASTDKCR